ncbi:hypothetical protein [Actinomyces glycerinitolerans]|uniref:Uncharacterized protein n=1 Tax=Actinomyces glycerinitolerans TaxID=1892869 RepID=A0A1M4S151_9ACTO|nr:hypothetical protein [Actinomyces glycerinitolerans]SHE25707.1 Hypothetical protein ACGLYG10_1937 [Actinomyces glycerinitolerans]
MSTDTTAGNDPEDQATASDLESTAWARASAPGDAAADGPTPDAPNTAEPEPSAADLAATPAASADAIPTASSTPEEKTTSTLFPPDPAPAPAAQPPLASQDTADLPPDTQADASPAAEQPEPRAPKARTEDDILLDGSSVVGRPKSRAAAHWAGVLVWVVALPLAWYLFHDGAAAAVDGATPLSFGTPVRALLELGAGAVVLAIALWTASRSSLGSFVVGVVSLLVGVPFLVAPTAMNGSIGPLLDRLTAHSNLGASLSSYFWADAVSGKFVAFGMFMIMVGVVSHNARRAGRREQEIIDRGRHND